MTFILYVEVCIFWPPSLILPIFHPPCITSFAIIIVFVLKFILSDINVFTPAFLCLMSIFWWYFFQPLLLAYLCLSMFFFSLFWESLQFLLENLVHLFAFNVIIGMVICRLTIYYSSIICFFSFLFLDSSFHIN